MGGMVGESLSCVWSYHFSAKIPIHSIRIMLTLPLFFSFSFLLPLLL